MFALLALLVSPTAYAADLASGSSVQITNVSTEDAYYASRSDLIGKKCTVGADGLDISGKGNTATGSWYSGPVTCEGGTSYYFYQVSLNVLDSPVVVGTVVSTGDGSCPAGAFRGSGQEDGARVTVLAVHPDDAYFDNRGEIEGRMGVVSGDIHNNGDCWFGGSIVTDGTSRYFYKAAVSVGGTTTTTTTGPTVSGSPISAGTGFTIVDLDPADAYYGRMSHFVGQHCVATGTMTDNGSGYYGGPADCDREPGAYFFMVEVTLDGSTGPTTTSTGLTRYTGGGSLPAGTAFRIADLSPDDAYYSDRASYIGLECVASEAMNDNGGSWYGGQTRCGSLTPYFYKVGVALSEAPQHTSTPVVSGSRYSGRTLKKGKSFTILEVSPEDAYYSTRSEWEGRSCVAKEALTDQGGSFYSGPAQCGSDDAYFYKVAISSP